MHSLLGQIRRHSPAVFLLMCSVTTSWSLPEPTTIYVSDTSFGNIFKFDAAGQRTTFASNINSPTGLAFDMHGNLYVSNAGNQTIEKYDPSGNMSVFANGGFLNQPRALAFDRNGVLYVTNANTNTIIKVDSTGLPVVPPTTSACENT